MTDDLSAFADVIRRWRLTPDGSPSVTHSSRLLPVVADGLPAMLKLTDDFDERGGGQVMVYWNGGGAARVLAYDEGALLLERATGGRSLAAMARAGNGQDDEASRILCDVAGRLHAPRPGPEPELTPLAGWFEPLLASGAGRGGLFADAAVIAARLLAGQGEVAPLHGDLHHDNVLDFGARGWLAIDPKRLKGDRMFDFANIFRDPDLEVAIRPGRLARQASVIAERAGGDRRKLLEWTFAFAALSAIWILDDDSDEQPDIDLSVMQIAAAEIARA